MTFEEFFTKKKIDLFQLKQAEPNLFSEFESHFKLMGEKSFDHTKKYWFNKLRKTYHLKEVPKPGKETIFKTEIASQAEPLSSPTIDQKPVEEPILDSTTFSEEAKPIEETKPAYKPKFNLKNIPKKVEPENLENTEIEKGKSGSAQPERNNPEETLPEEEVKPAYKPRFNMKNIKPKSEE